jgi:hypothetical protein
MLRACTPVRFSNAGLADLEDQRRGQVAVGAQEVVELREEVFVGEARRRDVAEDADPALLLRQPAHDLHAAEQQEVVDGGDQARRLGDRQVFRRHDHPARGVAQPRVALVIGRAPLRQADHRLQVEVDAVVGQRLADDLHHPRRPGLGPGPTGGEVRGGGRRLLVEPAAHLVDQVFQEVDLVGQFGAAGQVELNGPRHLGQPPVQPDHLVQQDAVGVADRLDLAAQFAHLQEAHDHPVGGQAQPEHTHQRRDRHPPAGAVAPERQRRDQRQAEVGRKE